MRKGLRMLFLVLVIGLAPVMAFGQSNTSTVDQYGEGNIATVTSAWALERSKHPARRCR